MFVKVRAFAVRIVFKLSRLFLKIKKGAYMFKKSASVTVGISGSVSHRAKFNISGLHIRSSEFFANQCKKIEDEEQHLDWGKQPRNEENRQYALASVILAVGALESSINEVFHDALSGSLITLRSDQQALLAQVWPEIEKFSVLGKYQIALIVCTCSAMDEGTEPYQSADALIRLRNNLVHYKPEWDDSLDKHDKLERQLKRYFSQSRLAERAKGRMVWFPNRCLGAGCALWACNTAKRFSKEFCELMGIEKSL